MKKAFLRNVAVGVGAVLLTSSVFAGGGQIGSATVSSATIESSFESKSWLVKLAHKRGLKRAFNEFEAQPKLRSYNCNENTVNFWMHPSESIAIMQGFTYTKGQNVVDAWVGDSLYGPVKITSKMKSKIDAAHRECLSHISARRDDRGQEAVKSLLTADFLHLNKGLSVKCSMYDIKNGIWSAYPFKVAYEKGQSAVTLIGQDLGYEQIQVDLTTAQKEMLSLKSELCSEEQIARFSSVGRNVVGTVGRFEVSAGDGAITVNRPNARFPSTGLNQWALFMANDSTAQSLCLAFDRQNVVSFSSKKIAADTYGINLNTDGSPGNYVDSSSGEEFISSITCR